MRLTRFPPTGPVLAALVALLGCGGGSDDDKAAADVAAEVAADTVDVAEDTLLPDTSVPVDTTEVADVAIEVTEDIGADLVDAIPEDTIEDALADAVADVVTDAAEDVVADAVADAGPDGLAKASGCVVCHTDKAKLQALLPEEPEGSGETSAG